jgi:DNA-binding transcriptional LysR family regulator
MDVQQMRYVLEVAKAGSIRAAAAALFVAPQSLSEQLLRVERSVGASLFTRTSAGMVLTEVGEVFVAHATDAVAAFDRADEAVRRAADGQPAELRLAWAYGLADLLQELLRLVLADSPDQPVRVIAMGCAAQRTALSRGEITAGLAHQWAGTPTQKGIRRLVVDSSPARALLPARHPLAGRPSVTLADLATEPLLLPTESGVRCLREWELAEFDQHGLTPRIGAEVSSIDLAVATVASGGGYALCVPTSHPVGDDLRFVPLADDLSPKQVALTWSGETPSPLIRAARKLARRSPPGRPIGNESLQSSRSKI